MAFQLRNVKTTIHSQLNFKSIDHPLNFATKLLGDHESMNRLSISRFGFTKVFVSWSIGIAQGKSGKTKETI